MKQIILGSLVMVSATALTACYTPVTPAQISAAGLDELTNTVSGTGYVALNCVGQDSDGDGYVSCMAKNEKTGDLKPFECAWRDYTSGCKIPQNKTIIND